MVFIEKLKTKFYTSENEEVVAQVMWDAIHELKSIVKKDVIQFICDILECNAIDKSNNIVYQWIH